jgi:hypothetical protein
MGRLPAVLLAAVVGCYHGNPEQACHVRCTPGGPCPSGLACESDGLCHNPDGTCPIEPADADLRPDVPPDELIANCYGTGLLKFCAEAPTAPLTIGAPKAINTSTNNADCTVVNIDASGDKVCLVLVKSFAITSNVTLTASGKYPLAIISDSTIDIAGFIDVSGQTSSNPAGANLGCSTGTDPMISIGGTVSAGGGAGGSSGTVGFPGGNSAGGVVASGLPGAAFLTNPSPGYVRGGCDGQDGAMYMQPARGGAGGGAVYLIARTSIHFTSGWIDASGGPGATSGYYAGGGGGGAGGLIGLDAPTIDTTNGFLMANGGAGACGSSGANAQGTAGHVCAINLPTTPAKGGCRGDGTFFGGAGGNGAASTFDATAGDGVTAGFGGGGGGGGIGYLLVYGSATLGGHSPADTHP